MAIGNDALECAFPGTSVPGSIALSALVIGAEKVALTEFL